MNVPRAIATALTSLALPLSACDPSYTLHLATTVKAGSAPVANAWVIPLRRTRRDSAPTGVQTGRDGVARTDTTAFLHNPINDPVSAKASGRPLCVVRAGADVQMHGRGFFFVTEYDAAMTIDLDGKSCSDARRMPLACADGRCQVTRAEKDDAFCDGYRIDIGGGQASATPIPETLGDAGTPASPRQWTFALPEGRAREATTAFALVCVGRQGKISTLLAE